MNHAQNESLPKETLGMNVWIFISLGVFFLSTILTGAAFLF